MREPPADLPPQCGPLQGPSTTWQLVVVQGRHPPKLHALLAPLSHSTDINLRFSLFGDSYWLISSLGLNLAADNTA